MSDKLLAAIQTDPIFCSRVIDLFEYMARKKAVAEVSNDPEITDKPQSKKGPHWHCYVCGWDKDIPSYANPKAPHRCGKCKSPYWQQMPSNGPHDLNCEDCIAEIERLKVEAQRINEIVDSFKK